MKFLFPELFLTAGLLFQLLFNAKTINSTRNNYPIIDQETLQQTLFILG